MAQAPSDAYMLQLLNSGKYSDPQAAIDAYNTDVYGAPVTGPGNAGYGSSPAYYGNGNEVGLTDAVLSDQNGVWTSQARGPNATGSAKTPGVGSTPGTAGTPYVPGAITPLPQIQAPPPYLPPSPTTIAPIPGGSADMQGLYQTVMSNQQGQGS